MRSSGAPPPSGDDVPPQPRQIPDVPTPSYARAVSETWTIELMMQMQHALGELKAQVNQGRVDVELQEQASRADFRWTWGGLAAATVMIVGALIAGYLRLEDRQSILDAKLTRVENKLDDVLQRMPPALLAPAQPPRR